MAAVNGTADVKVARAAQPTINPDGPSNNSTGYEEGRLARLRGLKTLPS